MFCFVYTFINRLLTVLMANEENSNLGKKQNVKNYYINSKKKRKELFAKYEGTKRSWDVLNLISVFRGIFSVYFLDNFSNFNFFSDNERREKVKRIYAEAAVQQSELNSIDRKKKRK